MQERVVHCMEQPFDVYIGRKHPRFPNGSKWQSPFIIGKDCNRTEVLEKFRTWLPTQKELMQSLGDLEGKTLGCWCKSATDPKPCHGDIYLEMLALRRKNAGQKPKPLSKNRPNRITRTKKRLVRMPSGSTPQGLVKFMVSQGVHLSVENMEIFCSLPDDLNPTPFDDVLRAKKNFLLAAIGGCESCKACGSTGENNLVCAYDAFFLGKASKTLPVNVASKSCPLNSLQIV